ncbi:unnamed protein product [Brachionus calyciflorus]|uniref:Uncharacterized protein n=1 Tax=Brachionus calyciflorus TaxID=104777 RepID=A0A814PFQ0_9BILA|nr:unnamed protein product [Brachionus calyciflorus]
MAKSLFIKLKKLSKNCKNHKRCVICGQNHTAEFNCKETGIKTCANCNEAHTANYLGCSIFKSFKNKINDSKKNQNKENYSNIVKSSNSEIDNKLDILIENVKNVNQNFNNLNSKISDIEKNLNKKIEDVELKFNKQLENLEKNLNSEISKRCNEIKSKFVNALIDFTFILRPNTKPDPNTIENIYKLMQHLSGSSLIVDKNVVYNKFDELYKKKSYNA